jgi:DNA-binding beta-propeller fold protein YncE
MRRSFALLAVLLPTLAQAADLKVVDSIKGEDGGWDLVSVDTASNRLFVARTTGVMSVDLATKAVTMVPGKHIHDIVGLPGGLAAATNGDTSDITLFKIADGSVLGTVPTGSKPDAIAYDPKNKLVAVMNAKDGTVSLVDADKKAVVGTVTVGGALELAVADGQGKLFLNVEDKNELVAIDVAARKVAARYPLTGCDGPTGLALDEADHLLLSACGNGKAVATSSVDGHVVATLPIGSHPDTVIYDEKNKRFLVPCGGDGVLSVISAEGGRLASAGSVPTEKGARTGAIDPATGKVYLPTAQFQPAQAGERPKPVPGTFHVLVLSGK